MTPDEAFLDAIEVGPDTAELVDDDTRQRIHEADGERWRGHRERVDPDEPWRYACPDCGDYKMERRKGGTRPQGKRYGPHEQAQLEHDRQKRFFCIECSERKMTVIDRTDGSEVQP